jgi:RNA recognition motif-containing protein
MSARLFVGNLSFELMDNALRDAFAEFGAVQRAEIVRDRFEEGRSRGFGFVEMASLKDAERALQELNGKLLMGRRLRIEHAVSLADSGRHRIRRR